MGADGGLWFYWDEQAVCGTPGDAYRFTTIPDGVYALMTVSDPFAFSAARAWDILCLWTRKNGFTIVPADLGGAQTPMLCRFYKQEKRQMMEIAVPTRYAE